MKKPYMKGLCILLGIVFIVLISAITMRMLADRSFVFVSVPTIEHSDTVHLANNQQKGGLSHELICVDEQLYSLFFSDRKLKVYQHENGKTKKVFQTSNFHFYIGSSNEYLYYIGQADRASGNYPLRCCNIISKEEYFIYSGKLDYQYENTYFSSDGSLYVPLSRNTPAKYIHVLGAELLSDNAPGETFALGGREYSAVPGNYLKLSCNDRHGKTSLLLFPKGEALRSIIPCQDGILVHVKSTNGFIALYWIEKSGLVSELFSVPCMNSVCALNLAGTDVYLSFMRFEKWGNLGMLRYENDNLEGTWKISLTDFTYQKINDQIFDGLYNFDDTGFYCTDEKHNIYKMDFEGNVTPIYIKRRLLASLSE